MTRNIHGLYAVTPDGLEDADLVARVDAALLGGATVVQYRNKRATPEARDRQARALIGVCRRHAAPLIINDHLELAAAVGADGVHLGSEDGAIAEARAVLGPHAIIGASCYDRIDNARYAQQSGASYVAFGSYFLSGTKPEAARASPDLLREAKRMLSLPIVAIGGITRDNAKPLLAAGADSIAVISALFDAADVRAAAAQLAQLFLEQ